LPRLVLEVIKSPGPILRSKHELREGVYIVGRAPTVDIVIVDPYVSRRHAKIYFEDGKWWIEDLGSTNGTLLNNDYIPKGEKRELHDGDVITLGQTRLKVVLKE